jgi:hypothetical protein
LALDLLKKIAGKLGPTPDFREIFLPDRNQIENFHRREEVLQSMCVRVYYKTRKKEA